MKQVVKKILPLLLLVGVLPACGTAAPPPTATPVPPTSVPTAVPPTATQPAATQAGSGGAPAATGPLADAMNKVKQAKSYRVDMNISGKGNFSVLSGATPAPGASDQAGTLLAMKGEISGSDAHFTLQGMVTSFLGIDPSQTFEVISYHGTGYVKGPIPILGANETRWYVAPAQASQLAQPPLTPSSFFDTFGSAGISFGDFQKSGSESVDNKACDVYAGDKTAVVNAFNRLGGATGATQEDLNSIDRAEFKFWVCDDGYLHQVRMLIEGHDKTNTAQKGSFEVAINLSDFDVDLKITPPADAVPMPTPGAPSGGTVQPGPTATP